VCSSGSRGAGSSGCNRIDRRGVSKALFGDLVAMQSTGRCLVYRKGLVLVCRAMYTVHARVLDSSALRLTGNFFLNQQLQGSATMLQTQHCYRPQGEG